MESQTFEQEILQKEMNLNLSIIKDFISSSQCTQCLSDKAYLFEKIWLRNMYNQYGNEEKSAQLNSEIQRIMQLRKIVVVDSVGVPAQPMKQQIVLTKKAKRTDDFDGGEYNLLDMARNLLNDFSKEDLLTIDTCQLKNVASGTIISDNQFVNMRKFLEETGPRDPIEIGDAILSLQSDTLNYDVLVKQLNVFCTSMKSKRYDTPREIQVKTHFKFE